MAHRLVNLRLARRLRTRLIGLLEQTRARVPSAPAAPASAAAFKKPLRNAVCLSHYSSCSSEMCSQRANDLLITPPLSSLRLLLLQIPPPRFRYRPTVIPGDIPADSSLSMNTLGRSVEPAGSTTRNVESNFSFNERSQLRTFARAIAEQQNSSKETPQRPRDGRRQAVRHAARDRNSQLLHCRHRWFRSANPARGRRARPRKAAHFAVVGHRFTIRIDLGADDATGIHELTYEPIRAEQSRIRCRRRCICASTSAWSRSCSQYLRISISASRLSGWFITHESTRS